jgi:hypothetical protein
MQPIAPISIKLTLERQEKLERIDACLALFCFNRSDVINFCIDIVYGLMFTPWIVERTIARLQTLFGSTLEYQRVLPFEGDKEELWITTKQ